MSFLVDFMDIDLLGIDLMRRTRNYIIQDTEVYIILLYYDLGLGNLKINVIKCS